MANAGSREHGLAHPAGAENPLLPTLTFTASHSDIETLIRIWDRDIVRAARSVVARDRHLSDDSAEECAQAARIALARLAHRASELGPSYLRRVIQNAIRDEARRERRIYGRSLSLDKAAPKVATEGGEGVDTGPRILEWAARLPGRFGQLYDLLYVQGCSQRATAVTMGVSQPRIAQLHRELLTRGRAELRALAA